MSFSFRRTANSKDEAKEAVKEQMAEIVTQQPIHASDSVQVIAAASAYIDLLANLEEGDTVIVTVSGSLGWHGDQSNAEFISANVGINVALAGK